MTDIAVQINPDRLQYLLKLLRMDQTELADRLGCKKPLTEKDLLGATTIPMSLLKKMDKQIFRQGLPFYTDPAPPPKGGSASIFYRKGDRALSFRDRLVVYGMEEEFRTIEIVRRLAGEPERKRHVSAYSIKDTPREVAEDVKGELYPKTNRHSRTDRAFLQALFNKFGDHDILVLEFIESNSRKERTSIEGMCLDAKIGNIALKRQNSNKGESGSLKREIFTCAHELGHYLLREEELDRDVLSGDLGGAAVEKWCNQFALHFLTTEQDLHDLRQEAKLGGLSVYNETVKRISTTRNISRCALFFAMAEEETIDFAEFGRLKKGLAASYEEYLQRGREARDKGVRFSPPRPIRSNLERDIFTAGFRKGAVGEFEYKKRIRPSEREFEALVG